MDKSIFKHAKRTLCNIFITNPALAHANIQHLLCIRQEGKERMFSYIRQHKLVPPTELKSRKDGDKSLLKLEIPQRR